MSMRFMIKRLHPFEENGVSWVSGTVTIEEDPETDHDRYAFVRITVEVQVAQTDSLAEVSHHIRHAAMRLLARVQQAHADASPPPPPGA